MAYNYAYDQQIRNMQQQPVPTYAARPTLNPQQQQIANQEEQQRLQEAQRRVNDPVYQRQAQQTSQFLQNDGNNPQQHPAIPFLNSIHSLFTSVHGQDKGTQLFINFFKNMLGIK